MKVSISKYKFDFKPSNKSDIIKVGSERLTNVLDLSAIDLAAEIAKGYSWSPAIFKDGKRLNNTWISQQFFALDFDSGMTPDEAINICDDFGISWLFWIPSFSDTPELRKFRLVFAAPVEITDPKIRDQIQTDIMTLFFKADKSCKDRARFFFGANAPAIHNPSAAPIDFSVLTDAAIAVRVGAGSRYQRGREYQKALKNGYSYVLHTSTQECAVFEEDETQTGFSLDQDDFDSIKYQIKKATLFPTLINELSIMEAFINGHHKNGSRLRYHEIFSICQNLVWIPGAQKWLEGIFHQHALNQVEPFNLASHTENPLYRAKQMKALGYTPKSLINFSPYEEDSEYRNIIDVATSSSNRFCVRDEDAPAPITLGEAEVKLSKLFNQAISANDNKVYMIHCPTGLGKTKQIEDLQNGGYVIAFPTHKLKREVAQRCDDAMWCRQPVQNDAWLAEQVKYVQTPELPELPTKVKGEIDTLYRLGMPEIASEKLSEFNNTLSDGDILKSELKEYFKQSAMAYAEHDTDVNILTTHQKALDNRGAWKNAHTVIFDEDIMHLLLSINTFKNDDVSRVNQALAGEQKVSSAFNAGILEPIRKYFHDLRWAIDGKQKQATEPTAAATIEKKTLRELLNIIRNDLKGNIIDFIDSACWLIDDVNIAYLSKRALPQDKKVIIMSATADKAIYEKLLGNRLVWLDVGSVEAAGSIEQDNKHSYSKVNLGKQHVIDYVKNDIVADGIFPLPPVITFKSLKDQFESASDMHFGATEGVDSLKGKQIVVVGTPNPHPTTTLLYAYGLTGEVISNTKMGKYIVRRNGFKFKFWTYEDEILRSVHLHQVESELLQAAGRARHLREKTAKVKVFSRFPMTLPK